ncbi:MAG TPA: GNAT family N-acetyltransferase [Vicinamibacterales bacterium]|jgi:ribosomal protein S18 acetylase RimI-like enzyme|nr:GNAT family N-acetyltransferase [Vicinamibacterales bacterium]
MLHATLELARRIDRAEIDFCALASGAGQPDGVASLEVAGGRALCAFAGSPLNKVLGLGLGAAVEDADLDVIEAFYDERGIPVQIELCPLAAPGLASRLTKRGYRLQAFENQLARRLGAEEISAPALRVARIPPDLDDLWLRVVAAGFAAADGSGAASPPPPSDVVDHIRHVMAGFVHPDFERLLVWVGDEPAGAACAYVMDGVLGITGTSTLPAFRRHGVQQAAVAHVLRDAAGRAELAMATVEPGSISQRNFERFGFQVVYTRAIFVLD